MINTILVKNPIALSLLFASTHLFATCTTNNSNTSISTLSSTADGACIENSGTINTINSIFSHGIYSVGADVSNTNSGLIITSGEWSHGFYIPTGDRDININTGIITTTGDNGSGIVSGGANTRNTNTQSGTITTSGFYGFGMYSAGQNSVITNDGKIYNHGSNGAGINSNGDFSIISNSGSITTTGPTSAGINSTGTNSIINNSGNISVSGWAYSGIVVYGSNSTIINSGNILFNTNLTNGITSWAPNTTITNTGTISTADYGFGIFSRFENSTINNQGLIRAKTAINVFMANDNTVNILRGSIIIGDIESNYSSNTKLNMNLGAGASYAYSLTGDWTVSDLDNRPIAASSAYSAGIGAQETAAHMLKQRTSALTGSLELRSRSYISDGIALKPYWLDIYNSNDSRLSGKNYSTKTTFSNVNSGLTAGVKLSTELTPLELVVNVENNKIEIDNRNQNIDTTSLMIGVFSPNMIYLLGSKLSLKALLGHANHTGDRKVFTNSLLYNGTVKTKADYNSNYIILGSNLAKYYTISDGLSADLLLGLDLVCQKINAHSETNYFSWQDRGLNQIQSRIQAGLDYKLTDNNFHLYARMGADRRNLISGATQDYSINGTKTSFNTNNNSDTYITAQIGIKAQLEKNIQLYGSLNSLRSADNVSGTQVSVGLSAAF